MTFNELNTAEHFIIHQLTGINLNNVQEGMMAEDPVEYDKRTNCAGNEPVFLPNIYDHERHVYARYTKQRAIRRYSKICQRLPREG
jgi:hypothetical protein